MAIRTLRTCDRCGHEIGSHIYRVEKTVNPGAPSRILKFAPMDTFDFCSMGCLLGYYNDSDSL